MLRVDAPRRAAQVDAEAEALPDLVVRAHWLGHWRALTHQRLAEPIACVPGQLDGEAERYALVGDLELNERDGLAA